VRLKSLVFGKLPALGGRVPEVSQNPVFKALLRNSETPKAALLPDWRQSAKNSAVVASMRIGMRNILIAVTCVIMIAYVLYRSFTTLVILPFVTSRDSFTGVLSSLLVFLAAGAIVLSFTRRKALAASLATIVGAVALGSWFFVICTAPVWTRSYFVWFVVPEVCFSLAGFFNWLVQRPRSVGPVGGDRVLGG
jgi:hypothetical protein